MSRIEEGRNIVRAQIVYWGPPDAGKTTSLSALRPCVDPEERAHLYSVAAPDGTTALFDYLPLDEFRLGPYRVRTRVLAVPGRGARGPARLAVLRDADVAVFVADARRGALEANRDSLRELAGALRALGHDPGRVPVVWAFNRHDDPDAMSVGELRESLGIGDVAYETVASEGAGVFEAFSEAFRRLLQVLVRDHRILGAEIEGAAPASMLPQLVRGVRPRTRRRESRHLVIGVPGGEVPGAVQAIEANLGLVEVHVESAATNRKLEGRNSELMAINRVARSILSAMEADNLLVVLLDATAEHLEAQHASCVVFDASDAGRLRTHVLGFGRDPALALKGTDARLFLDLLRDSDGPVPANDRHNPELLAALRRVDRRVHQAMFQSIKSQHDRPAGWLGIYHGEGEPPLTTQGLLFLSSISRLAALGLEKIAMLDRMQRLSQSQEEAVRKRTAQLEMAYAKIRALNRGLEARVTERTRALEEANRKLKEARAGAVHAARLRGMGQLAASFAHEVNNPVAGLKGNLDYMRENLDDLRAQIAAEAPGAVAALAAIGDFEEVLQESLASAKRVADIIASLRRFGDEEDAPERFSLNSVVADAVTLLEERIRHAAELDLRLGDLPEMGGNGLELHHVVLALLTNAVEAVERAGRHGRITVTTFATEGKVTLVVKDDGCGIPEDVLPRVFEPFVSTKDGEPSAGLGLHCAYKTVEREGGTIRLRSRPGEGTTVTVVLPAAEAVGQSPHAGAAAGGVGA